MKNSIQGIQSNRNLFHPFIGFCFLLLSQIIQAKDFSIVTVADGLDHPWSIAFLPNNDMLVTERVGNLRIIREGKLLQQKISGLPELFVRGQGGLMDVILDPDYVNNKTLYLSYSSGSRNDNTLKVIRAKLVDMSLQQTKVILTIIAGRDTPHHYGARMVFLKDGTLLVTSGDGFNYREQAQNLKSMFGKILRINSDGSIPQDNPFVGRKDVLPEIYSYGHRNPQAILLSADGKIWQHEHGPKGGDELNLIKPGLNYGWPAITYGVDYSGAIISPYHKAKGMQQPVTYWVPSIAPSGMTEYQGDIFPQWKGNLFVAALAERSVRRLILKAGKVTKQEIMLKELNQRIRDIRTGPDGYLYVLTDSDSGSVLRLQPVKE
ncbi:MAG: glucose dehydrogenase [Kangiella sp.]|nr:MAG: glucose dehydrogenase [Kangiella sp.]